MRRIFLAVLVSASAFSDAGCDEQVCRAGTDTYCDGNVMHECVSDDHGPNAWHLHDCAPRFCIESSVSIACMLEPDPRPACKARGIRWICDGRERVYCLGEYVHDIDDCGDPSLCVEDASTATCIQPVR